MSGMGAAAEAPKRDRVVAAAEPLAGSVEDVRRDVRSGSAGRDHRLEAARGDVEESDEDDGK
ncbi:MAG: hypothetical protein J7480_05355 [Microbacteriaceae bacterium]|nr:hypothetical protein [Microbacteriaceae bacterium]